MNPSDLSGRLPFVIGVTGHRDIFPEDSEMISSLVHEVILKLKTTYISDDTPIVILSSLAKGADQLAAKSALELGAQLVAPLPMPPDEYRKDFGDDVAQFDELLQRAISAPVVPLVSGQSSESVSTDLVARSLQYQAAGIFVVRHCHVLIALWDGHDTKRTGGTAEIVRFKRDGVPLLTTSSIGSRLDGSEIGPVIHIFVARQSCGTRLKPYVLAWPAGLPLSGSLLKRGIARAHSLWHSVASRVEVGLRKNADVGSPWHRLRVLAKLTKEFNADARCLLESEEGRAQVGAARRSLFERMGGFAVAGAALEDQELCRIASQFAPRWYELFAVSDALAQKWQASFVRDWRTILAASFITFACFAMISHSESTAEYVHPIYFACMVFLLSYSIFVRLRRHQERYLDYRALAEALRVGVFWKLLGMASRYGEGKTESKRYPPDWMAQLREVGEAYPIAQPNELAWTKLILRALEIEPGMVPERISPTAYRIARECWIGGELAYFDKQRIVKDKLAKNLGRAGAASAVGGALLSGASLLLKLLFPDALQLHVHQMLVFGSAMLPGLAVILASYAEKLALKPQARQYDQMHQLFQRAYRLLPEELPEDGTREIEGVYTVLGTEAMRDSADWVALYRQRPIQALHSTH